MQLNDPIEQLIDEHVVFTGKISAGGYRQTKCRLCNDYKARAGFKNDGHQIEYHCFNCSTHSTYELGNHQMSARFRKVLASFDVRETDVDRSLGKNYLSRKDKTSAEPGVPSKTTEPSSYFIPAEIELPPDTFALQDFPEDDEQRIQILDYISNERGLELSSYEWMASLHPDFSNRLIIPYFRRGKVIYWQARYIDALGPNEKERRLGGTPQRYLSPSLPTGKRGIIFNYDELYRYTDDVLFITEGAIDSISIGNAIGLSGSTIDEELATTINRSTKNRTKVLVVDKFDKQNNGYKLGKRADELGWSVTCLDGDLKDSNQALTRIGDIMLNQMLHANIRSGFAARVLLELIKTR